MWSEKLLLLFVAVIGDHFHIVELLERQNNFHYQKTHRSFTERLNDFES